MLGTAFFLRLIFPVKDFWSPTAWNAESKLLCCQLSEIKWELLKKHFMSAVQKQWITYRNDTSAILFNNLPWNSSRNLGEFYKSIAFSMLYLLEIGGKLSLEFFCLIVLAFGHATVIFVFGMFALNSDRFHTWPCFHDKILWCQNQMAALWLKQLSLFLSFLMSGKVW